MPRIKQNTHASQQHSLINFKHKMICLNLNKSFSISKNLILFNPNLKSWFLYTVQSLTTNLTAISTSQSCYLSFYVMSKRTPSFQSVQFLLVALTLFTSSVILKATTIRRFSIPVKILVEKEKWKKYRLNINVS